MCAAMRERLRVTFLLDDEEMLIGGEGGVLGM